MNRMAIQRVGVIAAMKFGCLLGALVTLPPALVVALIGKWIIGGLRALLESWQNVELGGVLGQTLRVNLIPILKLDDALKFLQTWDAASWFVVLGILLVIILLGGIVIAALSSLSAGIYNLVARFSGGIEIETAADARAAIPQPAPVSQPQAWLTGGGLPANGWLLQGKLIRIGRDASNQLVLPAPSVAPVHAEIARQGERWIIRDLGSPGGTFVNDRPIRENLLKDGFRVRCGEIALVFHST